MNAENYKRYFKQLSKFGSVGVLTTTFGIICNYILLEMMSLPLYPVYVAVFLIGVFLSYLLNSHYTFKQTTNLKDGARYYASYIIGMLVGLALLYIFDHTLQYSDFLLTLIVIPFRFLITFVLVKLTVFKT